MFEGPDIGAAPRPRASAGTEMLAGAGGLSPQQ
jgi:hypothetical protein